jgi:hypothetical protein
VTVPSYADYVSAQRAIRLALAAIEANGSPWQAIAAVDEAVARCGITVTSPNCGHRLDDEAVAAAHDLADSIAELRTDTTRDARYKAHNRLTWIEVLLRRTHPDLDWLHCDDLDAAAHTDLAGL